MVPPWTLVLPLLSADNFDKELSALLSTYDTAHQIEPLLLSLGIKTVADATFAMRENLLTTDELTEAGVPFIPAKMFLRVLEVRSVKLSIHST